VTSDPTRLRSAARLLGWLAVPATLLLLGTGLALLASAEDPPYVDAEPSFAAGDVMDFPNARDRILWGTGPDLAAEDVTCVHPGPDGDGELEAGPPPGQEAWSTVTDDEGVELTYLASTAEVLGGVPRARCEGPGLESVRISPAPDPASKRRTGTGVLAASGVALVAGVTALRATRAPGR